MGASSIINNRDAAQFFKRLQTYLNSLLPPRVEISGRIQRAVAEAVEGHGDKSKAFPEGAFLNEFVIRPIHEFLKSDAKLTTTRACQALLSESHKSHKGIASGSPASLLKHPFTKAIGTNAVNVSRRWWDESAASCVSQSCPDLALRPPCPYKIVFEAKYFRKGGIEAAKTALVTGIYQSFYYRGLPRSDKETRHAAWDYDFSCFLIYDGTDNSSVLTAWENVREDVNEGCWNGANIYVMVLRGKE